MGLTAILRYVIRYVGRQFPSSQISLKAMRDGDREFAQFLYIAKGSAGEVRAQLYLALDRHYLSNERFETLSDKARTLSRLLYGLIRYLQQSEMTGKKYK
jgi:four helix bundle protein